MQSSLLPPFKARVLLLSYVHNAKRARVGGRVGVFPGWEERKQAAAALAAAGYQGGGGKGDRWPGRGKGKGEEHA